MTNKLRTSSKSLIVLILGMLIAVGPFSIDMYLPGFADVAKDFSVDISKVGYTLTSYFVGIALGQLAFGPLMDRFGRRKPLTAGLLLFIVSSIVCSFSFDLNTLIIGRFFMALGGCAGMVASKAMVRDLFEREQVADVLSTLMLIMGVAPIIAPTIGGYVVAAMGWRAVFYILAAFAILMLTLVLFILPDSAKPNWRTSLKPLPVARQYWSIFKNREFFIFGMVRGFSIGALLSYVSSAPFIFIEFFGLSAQEFGWVFGGNAAGLILGSQINRLVVKRVSLETITWVTSIMMCIFTSLGLIFAFYTASFWLVYPALFLMLFFIGFQNPNVTALSLEPFGAKAGSASALVGSLSMVFGSVCSLLVSIFVTEALLPLFYLLVGCSFLSLFFVAYHRYGFPNKSAYAQNV